MGKRKRTIGKDDPTKEQAEHESRIMWIKGQIFQLIFTEGYEHRPDDPFTLSCGEKSPYYFNCKKALLSAGGMALLAQYLPVCIHTICYKAMGGVEGIRKYFAQENPGKALGLGGLTLGADPLTYAAALSSAVFPLVVRKEPKDHGTRLPIEGHVDRVKPVIVVDDVITTGASTIKAIQAFRDAGLEVIGAIVLVDRQEMNGRENIEALGVPVTSIFTRSDFTACEKAMSSMGEAAS